MVLKLYGYPLSTCTRRVATVLHEKNVPFELIVIDLTKGEHKAPGYLINQPFGQIPYIDDDGFILYESRAICHYIATKYADQGTPLIPAGLQENAIFHQAASVELSHFNEYAEKAVAEKVFKSWRGLKPDQKLFDDLIANLSTKLDVYDAILSKQKYIAGNELTLADLYHLPYGALLTTAGSNIMDEKPNVSRWWAEITSRPSWRAVKDRVSSTSS